MDQLKVGIPIKHKNTSQIGEISYRHITVHSLTPPNFNTFYQFNGYPKYCPKIQISHINMYPDIVQKIKFHTLTYNTIPIMVQFE